MVGVLIRVDRRQERAAPLSLVLAHALAAEALWPPSWILANEDSYKIRQLEQLQQQQRQPGQQLGVRRDVSEVRK